MSSTPLRPHGWTFFFGNSGDDIRPGRKPVMLNQSQQVCISQPGLGAGLKYLLKPGSWDPGWERGRGQKSHDATGHTSAG